MSAFVVVGCWLTLFGWSCSFCGYGDMPAMAFCLRPTAGVVDFCWCRDGASESSVQYPRRFGYRLCLALRLRSIAFLAGVAPLHSYLSLLLVSELYTAAGSLPVEVCLSHLPAGAISSPASSSSSSTHRKSAFDHQDSRHCSRQSQFMPPNVF